MDIIKDKFNTISNFFQKKIFDTWNIKTTLYWNITNFYLIILNIIFFTLSISLRNDNCIPNISFDFSDCLLLVTSINLCMILISWMFNFMGNKDFWLSLFNLIHHHIILIWNIISSLIFIVLIIFSNCIQQPIFYISLIYLLSVNMCGMILISIFIGLLLMETIEIFNDRHSLIDNLII